MSSELRSRKHGMSLQDIEQLEALGMLEVDEPTLKEAETLREFVEEDVTQGEWYEPAIRERERQQRLEGHAGAVAAEEQDWGEYGVDWIYEGEEWPTQEPTPAEEEIDQDLLLGLAAGGSAVTAGIGGYLGSKSLMEASDVAQAARTEAFMGEFTNPFIERTGPPRGWEMDPRTDPATRYGFGSPEQQRAAREASAGARGARVATSPKSLYVPEGSFTAHYLDKDPSGAFRHKGKAWDYVREGTVGLLEEGKALSARGDEIERALRGGLLNADETRRAKVALDEIRASKQALAKVVAEMGGTGSPLRVPQSKGLGTSRTVWERAHGMTGFDPSYDMADWERDYKVFLGFESDQIPGYGERVDITEGSTLDRINREEKTSALKRMVEFEKQSPGAFSSKNQQRVFQAQKRYRAMAATELGDKVEKGLNNSRRYLDNAEIARDLMRTPKGSAALSRGTNLAKSIGKLALIPDPTDLVMLGVGIPFMFLAGPGGQMGQESEPGTLGTPLATALQGSASVFGGPLERRHLNDATLQELAEERFELASELHRTNVLSKEAFDEITVRRKTQGLGMTVLPPQRPERRPVDFSGAFTQDQYERLQMYEESRYAKAMREYQAYLESRTEY